MKKTLLAVAVVGAVVSGTAIADHKITGHVGSTVSVPTESVSDNSMTLEALVNVKHVSGLYGEVELTSADLFDSPRAKHTIVDLTVGVEVDVLPEHNLMLDMGTTYTRQLTSKSDEYSEVFAGAVYGIGSGLVYGYGFYDLKSDQKTPRVEVGGKMLFADHYTLNSELVHGFKDDRQSTLELGVSRSIANQHVISTGLTADLRSSDNHVVELAYRFEF